MKVVHENGGVYRIVSIGKPDFVKGQEEYLDNEVCLG